MYSHLTIAQQMKCYFQFGNDLLHYFEFLCFQNMFGLQLITIDNEIVCLTLLSNITLFLSIVLIQYSTQRTDAYNFLV